MRGSLLLALRLVIGSLVTSLLLGAIYMAIFIDGSFFVGEIPFEYSQLHLDSGSYFSQGGLFWLFGGLPAALISFFTIRVSGSTRHARLLAGVGPAVMVVPATWFFSFGTTVYLAIITALVFAAIGWASFVIAMSVPVPQRREH